MKKWWKHSKRNVIRGVFAVSCALLFFMNQKCVSFAEASGKIIPRSVKVRQSPDGNSEVIGSSSSGTTVTIISQATDASGYVWYEVYVDANKTGYIRSDMINVDSSSGSIPTSSSAAQADTPAQLTGTAPGAEVMPETGMENQYATIKARSAKIRSGASTSKSVVGSLAEGAQVIVSGQTEGTDKPWYYITFTGTDGIEKTGYVRSDLVTLGDMVPVAEPQPEEQQPEEQQPEQPDTAQTERNDYEVVNEGGEWWLYDWTDRENGTKQRLEEVLLAAHAQTMNDEVDMETLSRQRIVIIVLIGVIIALVVALTIMIFKLRDAYYETYEEDDDEEEDEEEEEEDNRRKNSRKRDDRDRDERESRRESRSREGKGREDREGRSREGRNREDREERGSRSRDERGREGRRREDADREEPVRKKSSARDDRQPAPRKRTSESDKRMPAREVTYEDDGVTPVKTAPKKKAKNFLVDDDDFEFEFLNMKSKDNDI